MPSFSPPHPGLTLRQRTNHGQIGIESTGFGALGFRSMLDAVNRSILEELQRDARLSMAELGRRINLSPPAVAERVHRLEREGVIRGYHAELDPTKLGFAVAAVVRVAPATRQLDKIRQIALDDFGR